MGGYLNGPKYHINIPTFYQTRALFHFIFWGQMNEEGNVLKNIKNSNLIINYPSSFFFASDF